MSRPWRRCRCPLTFSFPLIIRQTPGSINLIFLLLIGDDYRKVPFENQRRHSSKMAATAAILNLFSVNLRTNASLDWSDLFLLLIGGDYRKLPFKNQRRHSSKMATTAAILNLFSVNLRTNALLDWSDFLVANSG